MNFIDPYMRSALYKEISELYQYPEPDRLRTRQSENRQISDLLNAYASDTGLETTSEIIDLCRAICTEELESMQVEYVRLFDYHPPCPPYQSALVNTVQDNPAQLYLQIEACYRDFGLNVNPEFKDPPDHISMELEFMHFLSHLEGQAMEEGGPGDAGKYRAAQKAFMEDHIMVWVPQFASSVQTHAKLPFFRSLARITDSFIANEAGYLSLS